MLELKNVSFEVSESGEGKEIIKDISVTIPDNNVITDITVVSGGLHSEIRVRAKGDCSPRLSRSHPCRR